MLLSQGAAAAGIVWVAHPLFCFLEPLITPHALFTPRITTRFARDPGRSAGPRSAIEPGRPQNIVNQQCLHATDLRWRATV